MLRFLIGPTDSPALKAEIASSPTSVVKKSFGWLGGRVYIVKPTDGNFKELTRLFNLLDQSPHGRKSNEAIKYFVGGDSILSRTDDHAQAHHNAFIQSLKRPADYVQYVNDALEAYLKTGSEFTLRDLATQPIRQALFKGMFDTDLTPAVNDALNGFSEIGQGLMDDFTSLILTLLMGAYYTKKLSWLPQFSNARETYLGAIGDFIESQSKKILDDLHAFADGKTITNILSLTVIQLIKEEKPELVSDKKALQDYCREIDEDKLAPYLHNTYLRTVPSNITAGDNTMIVLSCGLTALAMDDNLLANLRAELAKLGITASTSADKLVNLISDDEKNGGLIHAFYLECLRRESLLKTTDHLSFETIQARYTDKALDFDGTHIEANSMILVLSGMPRFDSKKWQNPSAFNPTRFFKAGGGIDEELAKTSKMIFSIGARMCPANHVSKYIVKAFLINIINNFDLMLKLTKDLPLDQVHDQSAVKIKLLPLEDRAEDHLDRAVSSDGASERKFKRK
jgi:hypothetical protein